MVKIESKSITTFGPFHSTDNFLMLTLKMLGEGNIESCNDCPDFCDEKNLAAVIYKSVELIKIFVIFLDLCGQ